MKHKRLLFICLLPACIALATQAWARQSAGPALEQLQPPPSDVEAAPGNRSAAVSFKAAARVEGTIIAYYTVTAYTGGKVDRAAVDNMADTNSLIHVVTGLTNGAAYMFEVTATNSSNRTGPPAFSNSVVPSATPCPPQSVGQWNITAIQSGEDSPLMQECTMTVNPDGTTSGYCDVNGSASGSFSGNLWFFPDGMRPTLNGAENAYLVDWICNSNTSRTVFACTATVNDRSGSPYLSVATKQASSYSPTDAEAVWNINGVNISGPGSAYMNKGSLTLAGDGGFSGSSTNSAGVSTPMSGTWSLSSQTGALILNCVSGCENAPVASFMDAGKTVWTGLGGIVAGQIAADTELDILTRKASIYSLADLAGDWNLNQLNSDGTWERTSMEINADGSYLSREINSDGTTGTGSGKLAISSDGVVSCAPGTSDCQYADLVMDAGKTIMTRTGTENPLSSYAITIATRAASLWQDAVNLGGGWESLQWFGFFNASASPWIYHQTLGWLYPLETSTGSTWFYDPQWDGQGGWWATSSSVYPWLYSAAEHEWLYYDANARGGRWFFNEAGQASTH